MKRVLVIGEHSYIGTSFRDYMEKYDPGVEVELISARDENWKSVDFSGYDSVLHVAAIVHKKESSEMWQQYVKINIELPVEVAKKAKQNGVQNFLFMSTMAVYGNTSEMISKTTALSPESMYGKSKLEAEKRLMELADDDFHVGIFRPPMVYGKNCPGNYTRLAKLAYKMPLFPKIENQRSMIYIQNLCECIYESLEYSKENSWIMQPQNAEYVNTINLIKEIRKVHGKKTLVVPFPQKLMRILAGKSSMLRKVFGNLCYNKESDGTYQTIDFETSIQRTEQD